ncbi:MAG TPA: carbohydrate kinase family protein [Coriobacteriia bacterium]
MSEVRAFDLLVVGRPSVDIMFSGLPEWPVLGKDIDAEALGVCAGTSFNTPAAANRLGLRVGYISMIGNDSWSRLVREEFEAEALPTDFLRIVDRPLPFISVALNFDRDRGFVSYEDAGPEDDEELARYAREVIATTPARHYHGYAGEEPSELSTLARKRGMSVSLDAGGGPWWESPAPLEEMLAVADVLFANEPEALAMTGATNVRGAADVLAGLCPCVVVKRGAGGAMAIANGEFVERSGEPAKVLDTTGAGDCFNAGFLVGWLAGLPLEADLTLGNLCGARAVEAFGGYRGCPCEDDLLALAESKGIRLPSPTEGDRT